MARSQRTKSHIQRYLSEIKVIRALGFMKFFRSIRLIRIIRSILSRKAAAWTLAFAIVFLPYWALFTPSVWAKFKESVKVIVDVADGSDPEKFAFVGISPESGTEVFFDDGNGNVLQITSNSVEEGNSQYDGLSNKVVYQALVRNAWQIFLYDIETDTTQQLSYGGTNNTDPQIAGGQVVWQSWLDDNWEVFLYDGEMIRRVTDNDAPDIEPRVSNNIVVWSGYDSEQFGNPKTKYDPQGYEIYAFDNLKKEKIRLTENKTPDSHPSVEYPYVAWQFFDGEDDEIALYNLGDGTTSLVTNNKHADSLPRLKGGKIKWLEYTPEPVKKSPENLIAEAGKLKLKLRLINIQAKIDPANPPKWWEEPLKCPDQESVCAYVDDKFWSYANRCFVEKAGGIVLHIRDCNGSESIASLEALLGSTPTPIPDGSLTPEPTTEPAPSASESFTPEPSTTETPLLTAMPSTEPSPEASQDLSPSPVASPSQELGMTATPSSAPVEPPSEFVEPGGFENTGTVEDGGVIIEDREPVPEPTILEPEDGEATLPVVEDAEKPQAIDQPVLLKIGEAVNEAISGMVESAADLLDRDETNPTTVPAVEEKSDLIPVTDEPQI